MVKYNVARKWQIGSWKALGSSGTVIMFKYTEVTGLATAALKTHSPYLCSFCGLFVLYCDLL